MSKERELLDSYCRDHQFFKSWKEQKARKDFDIHANHFSYFDMERLASIALEAVRLAREEVEQEYKEHSENMAIEWGSYKEEAMKEVEARVVKKIFDKIYELGIIYPNRFDFGKAIVGLQLKYLPNSLDIPQVSKKPKSCCAVDEPDSGRDVDVMRAVKKEEK